MLDSIMVGRTIHTNDGADIGKVKEIEGRFFKVDAPMQPDYWLGEDTVGSIDTVVHLNIENHLIGDYMLSGPHDRGVDTDRNLIDDRDRGITHHEGTGVGTTGTHDEITEQYREANAASHGMEQGEVMEPVGNRDDMTLRYREAGAAAHGETLWTDEVATGYRREWETRYGLAPEHWPAYEPAYQFGYEMAYDQRFERRPWMDVEGDLQRGYDSWRLDQRAHLEWDRVREPIRDAYTSARERKAA